MDIARIIARTVAFVRNLFHRARVDDALDEELRAYVAGVVAEKVRDGMPPRDAERAARLELGGYDVVKEKVRDIRTGALLDGLLRDCRFAARTLRKTPVFTAVAVIALALGIGATTAMLSVVRSVLVEPLSYADADRLAVILHDGRNPASPRNFNDWRAQTRSFSDMAAAEYWSPDLTSGDNPTQVPALRITSRMLPMLGVAPLLGRVFSPAEEEPGNDHVVVLGYGLWQRMFAGRRDVLGSTVSLDGSIYTVIGVMPKSFVFAPFWSTDAQVWAPLALANRLNDGQSLRIFARLAPGVTLERARADLGAVTATLEARDPGSNRNVFLTPLKEKVVGNIRTPLLTLLVAVTFVLLTACANVAHMLLARAAARQRELSLRTALGATRARLFAQMLVESILLALLGGGAGFALAVLGIHALVAASPAIIPRVASVTLDGGVLAIAVTISAATVIVFGLLPALRAARVDPVESFRDGDRASSDGRGRARVRNALVASEFALALVLLIGTGLMIRTLIALQRIDPGFDPRNVVSMIVSTAGTPAADTGITLPFYDDSLARVRALPGIESASYINHRPFDGDMWGFEFRLEGAPHPRPGRLADRDLSRRVPALLRDDANPDPPRPRHRGDGSTGHAGRRRDQRVHGEDALARSGPDRPAHHPRRLDLAHRGRHRQGQRARIAVGAARGGDVPCIRATARVSEGTRRLSNDDACRAGRVPARRVRRERLRGADTRRHSIRRAQRADFGGGHVQALARTATAESRFYLLLLAAFAAIAVVLAAVGIYGVMAYAVSRRTHEIGIRIALGAEPGSVMRAVVGEGVSMASIGAAAGLATALGLTRLMRGILYGVSPLDVWTFAAVTALLVAVALVASLVPARRATRVDPLIALRSD